MSIAKKVLLAATCATGLAAAQTGYAGGMDRSGQFLGPVFETTGETGNYVQLSFGSVRPTANLTFVTAGGTTQFGSATDNYTQTGWAFKTDVTDALSLTLIYDQPFGASVSYSAASPFRGGFADIGSDALTLIARFKVSDAFAVHGGLRTQKLFGSVQTTRRLTASSDFDTGYVLGVSYEKPEIALRVALTYNSAVKNKMTGIEINPGPPASVSPTTFTVETPESLNLEFQTGIAKDTLLFGSVRHVRWDGFNLTTNVAGPFTYATFTGNTTTYSIGVGRRLNDNWSVAATLGYEAAGNRPTTTALTPTTGTKSIGLGGTYTRNNMKITGGVTYVVPGDQFMVLGPTAQAQWKNNKAIGAGLRVSFSF